MAKFMGATDLNYLWTKIKAYITSLGYTTNAGTITSVKMNGNTVSSSGEADLGTVLTSAPVTSVNGQTGAVTLNIPTVPSNLVTGKNSGGTDTAYTIQVVSALPASPDSSTIYLITGS